MVRPQKTLHGLELVLAVCCWVNLAAELQPLLFLFAMGSGRQSQHFPRQDFHAKYIPPLFLLRLSGQGREEKSLHSLCSWQ